MSTNLHFHQQQNVYDLQLQDNGNKTFPDTADTTLTTRIRLPNM